MFLSDFDFSLPPDLIARYPPGNRRDSRLLVLDLLLDKGLTDQKFAHLTAFLQPGDLLVFNDTRVMPARLYGQKETGGRVEILIERIVSDRTALAMIKASKSPRPGMQIKLAGDCHAVVAERQRDLYVLEVSAPIAPFLDRCGSVPLPPYLERDAESADDERYQTVYAKELGAVAAPTAGLHFDKQMFADIAAAGVRHAFATLHVGAGTFQSLREQEVKANKLHAEWLQVDETLCAAVNEAKQNSGRVIGVGTTAVRALESAANGARLAPFSGDTDLFIYPGFEFQIVDAMLTNFHLPQSSLLMLVSAFAGTKRILAAYRHAVRERYRFFSYGDAMLITSGPV